MSQEECGTRQKREETNNASWIESMVICKLNVKKRKKIASEH
jgi:hypothetical protein